MSDAVTQYPLLQDVGVVVIGRDEGERLVRCLDSVLAAAPASAVVYVDSGSTDASVTFARSRGIRVVELDLSLPFTAARARNAGLELLLETKRFTAVVQFVDGDCEVVAGWMAAGRGALLSDEGIAVVSGRLRERFPERSIYNRLADLEWDRPVGDELYCGGVAMMRVSALRRVGGFHPGLFAGEEPELCARLRSAGYRVVRIAHEMARHDLAMMHLAPWLRRARRHGRVTVEVRRFGAAAGRRLFSSQIRSILFWGAAWPVLLLAGCLALLAVGRWDWVLVWTGVFALAWTAQSARVAMVARRRGMTWSDSCFYGGLIMLGKFAGVLGLVQGLARPRPDSVPPQFASEVGGDPSSTASRRAINTR